MTRTVYPSREVCHLWANRAISHDIRNAGGTISTRSNGRILVSYGSHFAIGGFFKTKGGADVLLINLDSYSVTTSKHQSYARQALPQWRYDEALFVPGLNVSHFDHDNMREVARAAVNQSIYNLEKMTLARKYQDDYRDRAVNFMDTARKLYGYIGDEKSANELPSVTADCDKQTAQKIVTLAKCAEYLADARKALLNARANFGRVTDYLADWQNNSGFYSKPACELMLRTESTRKTCERAAGFYRKAGRKPAPIIARINSQCIAIESEYGQRAQTERDDEFRRDILDSARKATRELARLKHMRRHPRETINRTSIIAASYSARRMLDAYRHKGNISRFPAECVSLCERYKRILFADSLRESYDNARAMSDNFDHSPNHYSVPDSNSLQRNLAHCAQHYPRLLPFYENRAHDLIARIDVQRAEWRELETRKNAERITRWRNGEYVNLPHSVPTMARIRGDNLETSRGASVPLSHAIRFIRIAERIAARGGQSWERDSGPMVGHFRASRIGADLSATIGCHEFDAIESARIIAEIKSHPAYRATPTDTPSAEHCDA